jgi:hypothetical protein
MSSLRVEVGGSALAREDAQAATRRLRSCAAAETSVPHSGRVLAIDLPGLGHGGKKRVAAQQLHHAIDDLGAHRGFTNR